MTTFTIGFTKRDGTPGRTFGNLEQGEVKRLVEQLRRDGMLEITVHEVDDYGRRRRLTDDEIDELD